MKTETMNRCLLKLLLFVSVAASTSFAQKIPNCWFNTSNSTFGPSYVGNAAPSRFIIIGTISVPSPCYTTNAGFVPWQADLTSNNYDLALYCIRGNISDNTGCRPNKGYVHLGPTPGYVFYSECLTRQCGGTFATFVQVESWAEGRTLLPAGDYALGMGTDCNGSPTAGGGGGGSCGMGMGEGGSQSQLFTFKYFTNSQNTPCMFWTNGLPADMCAVPTLNAWAYAPHMINFAIFGVSR